MRQDISNFLQLLIPENTAINIKERLFEQRKERLHEEQKDTDDSMSPEDNCAIRSREHSMSSQPSTHHHHHQTRPRPSPLLHLLLQDRLATGPQVPWSAPSTSCGIGG